MQNQMTKNNVFNYEIFNEETNEEIENKEIENKEIEKELKTHRRSSSLRQRFEHAEQLVHNLLSEAESAAEQVVTKLCTEAWNSCNFNSLPKWLQDNDYLHRGHRPPLPSFWLCFKSIFRLHTETGNIWTHGVGVIIFLLLAIYYTLTIKEHKLLIDRLMLGIYFCGAITCLLLSTVFHTCTCHSRKVSKFFSKLDYCGISIQIIGSMIPALYYGFYDNRIMYFTYITIGVILCVAAIVISLWDKFSEPRYRSLRAIVFLSFGLSNIIPGIHWFIVLESHLFSSLILFLIQGLLYVIGAILYANRYFIIKFI
jgi:adiponectin receptor